MEEMRTKILFQITKKKHFKQVYLFYTNMDIVGEKERPCMYEINKN